MRVIPLRSGVFWLMPAANRCRRLVDLLAATVEQLVAVPAHGTVFLVRRRHQRTQESANGHAGGCAKQWLVLEQRQCLPTGVSSGLPGGACAAQCLLLELMCTMPAVGQEPVDAAP